MLWLRLCSEIGFCICKLLNVLGHHGCFIGFVVRITRIQRTQLVGMFRLDSMQASSLCLCSGLLVIYARVLCESTVNLTAQGGNMNEVVAFSYQCMVYIISFHLTLCLTTCAPQGVGERLRPANVSSRFNVPHLWLRLTICSMHQ